MRRRLSLALIAVTIAALPISVSSQRGKGTGTCSQMINGKYYQVPCADPPPSGAETTSSGGRHTSAWADQLPIVPDQLPGLVSDYHSARSWFSAFPDAPAAVQASNLSDLYFGVDRLHDFGVGKLRSLRSQKAALEKRYQELQDSIQQNVGSSNLLRGEIARLENDIALRNREINATEIQLKSQNSKNEQILQALSEMEREARSTKADLFQTLTVAAQRGLIQPPSSYQSLPKPIAPHYRSPNSSNPPLSAAGPTASFATEPFREAPLAPPSAAVRHSSVNEQQVHQKLAQVRSLFPEINGAINDVNSAYQRVQNAEQTHGSSSFDLSALRQTADSTRSTAAAASNGLATVKGKFADAVAAYDRQRERFHFECLELAFWKQYDHQVEELVKKVRPDVKDVLPAVNTNLLGRLVKVMEHVVQLNNETLAVAGKIPSAMVSDEDDLTALQAELDDVVNRFKANIFNDLTGTELLKYVGKK
jgi:hypothetical protein